MAERPSDPDRRPPTLIERKQAAARMRIIDAADALFDERGFDGVSVTDIAERAEVGRTTFFRHFRDKTEVVFAKEQSMSSAIADAASESWGPDRRVDSLAAALRTLEPLVIRLCEQATADPAGYERHERLLAAHEELRAREARKHQQMATGLAHALVEHGAAPAIATTAAQLALACYASGRLLSTSPDDLARRTRAAFRGALAMGASSADG